MDSPEPGTGRSWGHRQCGWIYAKNLEGARGAWSQGSKWAPESQAKACFQAGETGKETQCVPYAPLLWGSVMGEGLDKGRQLAWGARSGRWGLQKKLGRAGQ